MDGTTDGAIDAVTRDDDSTLEVEGFTDVALP
jgi:hypothetical protein